MPDILTKEKRSELMSRIKSRDTKIELLIRKAIYAQGIRYRINYKGLPGKPDIYIPKFKCVVFIHGCFWHGHANCKIYRLPKSNVQYWSEKVVKNKTRDLKNEQEILSLGIRIIVIWECEVKDYLSNIENLLEKITTQ